MEKRTLTNYAVARRTIDEDDTIWAEAEMVIKNVPSEENVETLKDILERTGQLRLLSLDGEESWNYLKVVPEDMWPKTNWTYHPTNLAEDVTDSVISYEELLDKIHDEKRFTLRLPTGLHVKLIRAAGKASLNQFCVDSLSKAVGYELTRANK